LACANALPARTLGSAWQRVAVTNPFNAITIDDKILTLAWRMWIVINRSPGQRGKASSLIVNVEAANTGLNTPRAEEPPM
jgi:hypothetical protein